MLADDPWEWRAVWMSGLALLDAATTSAARSRRSTPSTARCPGELAPKLALALACERGGEGGARRAALPRPAPAPTPTTSRRRRSAWPGSGPPAATSRGGARRSTWCRRPAGLSPRPAGCGRCSSTSRTQGLPVAGRGDGLPHGRPARPDRAGRADRPDPGAGAGRGRRRRARRPRLRIGPYPADNELAARRPGSDLPDSWPRHRDDDEAAATVWSTRPTRVRRWTLT